MKKFIFFDIKRNVIINVLLGIQICLWTAYMTSLISLLTFDKNFIERYEKSFDIENVQAVAFEKYSLKDVPLEIQLEHSIKLIDYLKKNKIEYGLYNKSGEGIEFETLNVTKKEMDDKFSKFIPVEDKIYLKEFNHRLLKNYIDIDEKEWNRNGNIVPCILGSSFKKKYKIGDEINNNGEILKIKGFLDEGMLISEGMNIGMTEILNSSVIIPIDEEKYLKESLVDPNIIIFDNGKISKDLPKELEKLTFYRLKENLDAHIKDINAEKVYDIGRAFTVTIIILGTIMVTIGYKIMSDKERIGILYALGGSKKEIKKIFIEEISLSILVGIFIGTLIYFKNNDKIYYVFMNETSILNLVIAMIIISILLVSIILINIRAIDKLTPKEMMGGLIE